VTNQTGIREQWRAGARTGRISDETGSRQPARAQNSSSFLTENCVTRVTTWLSLGLGIAQLAMPDRMTKLVGMRDNDDSRLLMRLVGLREMACGIGLLAGLSPASGLGARVAGDVMDLALLGSAFGDRRTKGNRLAAATAMVVGVTALDLFGALKAGRQKDARHSPTSSGRLTPTTQTIVVNHTPEDVYQFWLDFESFPRFMKHLESVTNRGNGRSHWVARGPAGKSFAWDAEIVENRPNELISWRSLPGADVENAGSVRFERAPGGRGTLVRVNLRYDPPGGTAGSMVAMLLGTEPGQEVQADLRRFKQVIETGEVVRSDASIHERSHPARPSERSIPLQTPVPVPSPSRQMARSDAAEESAWPEPDVRPSRRSAVDDVAVTAAREGDR
jgi:uncharacterized membrane protein